MMNKDRFAAILDAYGAAPRRWPAAEREAARAFLAADAHARVMQGEAEGLDEVLSAAPALAAPPELRARVLSAAPRSGRLAPGTAASGWTRFWAPGAGLAAAGVAGLMFGAVLAGGGPDGGAQALLAEAEAYDEAVLAEDEDA